MSLTIVLRSIPQCSATRAATKHSGGKTSGYIDSTLEVHEWKAHVDGAACTTCAFFMDQAKGGRPTKTTKNRGRPNKSSARYIADTIQTKAIKNEWGGYRDCIKTT